MTNEHQRLEEQRLGVNNWNLWGPYLSERQWGTVREDYSDGGAAWDYLPHDHARSRAYRWGEDGIAGISDQHQRLCLSLALWNGADPILKERIFGLTNGEGNHGEDVKELYYYLDATPTHSYLKMLYKYPQRPFPYAALVNENRRRGKDAPEFELLDTDAFDDDRYFDVFVEYAKQGPADLLMRVTVYNRGPVAAEIHVLPQLCFRNNWSWGGDAPRPRLWAGSDTSIRAWHETLGEYVLHADGKPELLFCENDTNVNRLYGANIERTWFKDGINDHVVAGRTDAVNPAKNGTKAALHYHETIKPGGMKYFELRLVKEPLEKPFGDFDKVFRARLAEADEFYGAIQAQLDDPDARAIQRQAFAGMIWSKQYFYYDVEQWIQGDPGQPVPPASRKHGRNTDWKHLNNADILSMPDKWEYPWYAAWDLAFHCVTFAEIDPEFAKGQLVLLTREWYMHPNGQLPAYEWAFGDVNPPVHAWAVWRVFEIDRAQRGGDGDVAFLERVFHKLLLNFNWWVNRKDAEGRNIFQGGFLGLDNIGVFDRSAPLPTGGYINQSDGTSWMAMYALNLLRIALELSGHNPVYQDIATKFFEHFLHITEAMNNIGEQGIGLWDMEDEFYYDVLALPSGEKLPRRLRTLVGLIPLFAVEVLEPELLARAPDFTKRMEWFLKNRPALAGLVSRWAECGKGETRLLSVLRGHRMKCLLRRMLDESEFLSDYGVRSISKQHEAQPYELWAGGNRYTVQYQPGESLSGLFGGNSNWRGPIWFPVNYLIVESLRRFHRYYGDDFRVECPTGSGIYLSLNEIADELAARLTAIFRVREDGSRAVFGAHDRVQKDPRFRDHLLFHEYFHGDTGQGIGASHQTGWTGLVANLLIPNANPASMPAEERNSHEHAAI